MKKLFLLETSLKLKKVDGLTIELPCLEDVDRLYQIELSNYGENESTELDTFKEIITYLNDSTFYQMKKASLNEQVVGFYCLIFDNEKTPDLVDIAVSKAYQNKGIGAAMMLDILQNLPEMTETISLTVRISNKPAVKLYKKFGFVEAERVDDYYGNGESALKMKLVLT